MLRVCVCVCVEGAPNWSKQKLDLHTPCVFLRVDKVKKKRKRETSNGQ